MYNIRKITAYLLKLRFWFIFAAQFFLPLYAQQYGTLEIALLLHTPDYAGNATLLSFIRDTEQQLNTKILTDVIALDKQHMTLSYPLIPLDQDVIKLFPNIEQDVEMMPSQEKAAAYQKRIPGALSTWLTTHVRQWFTAAEQWREPITLPFLHLRQLSKFLVAEFSHDAAGRLMHIVNAIRTGLQRQFSKVTYAFSDMIPHLSIGILNPAFNIQQLVQPTVGIPPLVITKSSEAHITASVRMKK